MTYDFQCQVCNFDFSADIPISTPKDKFPACPDCGIAKSKRLISGPPAIALKGGGWAKDGYAKQYT